jgi:hypothetical protein
MVDESMTNAAPIRREYLKYGGTVVGGGLLAGCISGGRPRAEKHCTARETAMGAGRRAGGDT